MQIRKAMKDDAEGIAQILHTSRLEYLSYATSPHSIQDTFIRVREELISSNDVVIVKLNGEDVGVLATSVTYGIG